MTKKWMGGILVMALMGIAGAAEKPAAKKNPESKKWQDMNAQLESKPATLPGKSYTLVSAKQCDGHAIEVGFRDTCKKLGAQVDGMMLSHGMGFVAITKKSPEDVAALQEAAKKQDVDYKALGKKKDLKICEDCKFWMEWWEDGQFDSEIVNIKHGAVNIVTGKTPQAVQGIHEEIKKEMEKMQMEGHQEEE